MTKHAKKCSASLAMMEIQMKAITRYPNTPIRMSKTFVITQNAGKDMESLGLSYIASGNIKCCSLSRKQFFSFLKNETSVYHMIQQLHSLAFTPRNKTLRSCKTCTQMFTAALFTITSNCKQLRCSTGDWLNNL